MILVTSSRITQQTVGQHFQDPYPGRSLQCPQINSITPQDDALKL